MRTSAVDPFVESGRRPAQRFERHRAGDIGDAREAFRAEQSEAADRVHRLGAVEQREAFLGLEFSRLQSGPLESVARWRCVRL